MITQTPKILVKDEEQLEAFLTSIMPPLERDEVYFLSLSARNKYLTDKEREQYDLGRTEMFSRQIAYDHEGVFMALARMEADLFSRKTRGGQEIPEKCLVTYINIHPSSTLKAYTAFKAQLDNHYNETFMAIVNGKQPNYEPFIRSHSHLMNHIQRSTSHRKWVDIDIDGEGSRVNGSCNYLINELIKNKIQYHRVKTQGGIHLLINKENLNDAPKDFKLHDIVNDIHKLLKLHDGEAKFNSNAMVPLPGTHQAGNLVIFA